MKKIMFEVKPEHLLLMRRFCVGWDDSEFGAPEIDPKRPYGNSDVLQDMLEILGIREIKGGIFGFDLFGVEYLLKGEDKHNIDLEHEDALVGVLKGLHKETETALQICLATGAFKIGKYQCEEYDTFGWEKING